MHKQKNPELYQKTPLTQKSKLPGIKGTVKDLRGRNIQEVEPLKTISVNYKSRDVEFVHFKQKNAMSPNTFSAQIKDTNEESKEKKDNQMRLKINESIDIVHKIRSGGELPDN